MNRSTVPMMARRHFLLGAASGIVAALGCGRYGHSRGDLPFLKALAKGDLNTIKRYLGSGIDPNLTVQVSGNSIHPAAIAAIAGNPRVLVALVEAGADLSVEHDGLNPIEIAYAISTHPESAVQALRQQNEKRTRALGSAHANWRANAYSMLSTSLTKRVLAIATLLPADHNAFAKFCTSLQGHMASDSDVLRWLATPSTLIGCPSAVARAIRNAIFTVTTPVAIAELTSQLCYAAIESPVVADRLAYVGFGNVHDESGLLLNKQELDDYVYRLNSTKLLESPAAWSQIFRNNLDQPNSPSTAIPSASLGSSGQLELPDRAILAVGYLQYLARHTEDPAGATAVLTIANTVAQVARTIMRYKAASDTHEVLAAAEAAGDLITAGVQLYMALDGGPSVGELTLNQIVELRKDIEQLRQELHERFDIVDRRLLTISRQVWADSERQEILGIQIIKAADEIKEQVATVTKEQRVVSAQLLQLGRFADLSSIRTRAEHLADHKNISSKEVDKDEIIRFLRDAVSAACRPFNKTLEFQLVSRTSSVSPFGKLVDDNESSFADFAACLRHIQAEVAIVSGELPNLATFLEMSKLFLDCVAQHPEVVFANVELRKVEYLHSVTSVVNQALLGLRNAELIDSVLRQYAVRVTRFAETIQQAKAETELDTLGGFDCFGTPRQPIDRKNSSSAFQALECGPCEENYTRVLDKHFRPWNMEWKLPLSKDLAQVRTASKYIPQEFLVAHQLGLGEIKIEYGDANWDSDRREGSGIVSFIGKAAITVRAWFASEGERYPIFERRCMTDDEYKHAIVCEGKWAHGNVDPQGNASMDARNPQWLQWKLMQCVPQLIKSFESSVDSIRPDLLAKSIEKAASLIEKRLAESRMTLDRKVLNAIVNRTGRISEAFREVEGVRQLLLMILRLSFYHEVTTNKELACAGYGLDWPSGGLMNLAYWQSKSESTTECLSQQVTEYASSVDCHMESLNEVIRTLIQQNPGDPHPEIERIKNPLTALLECIRQFRSEGSVSFDEVITKYREAFHELSR